MQRSHFRKFYSRKKQIPVEIGSIASNATSKRIFSLTLKILASYLSTSGKFHRLHYDRILIEIFRVTTGHWICGRQGLLFMFPCPERSRSTRTKISLIRSKTPNLCFQTHPGNLFQLMVRTLNPKLTFEIENKLYSKLLGR